jgi:anti-anti-sigma factor
VNKLSVRIDQLPGALHVVLSGEAGMHEADDLHLMLTRVLATRPKLTLIDLTQVTMIASITMGALLSFKGGLKVQGGRMKLIVTKGNVRDSLRHARLDQVLDACETLQDALKPGAIA